MLFKVLAFSSLQVEPSVGDCTDVWEKRLNKWVEFILREVGKKRCAVSSVSNAEEKQNKKKKTKDTIHSQFRTKTYFKKQHYFLS